MDWLHTTRRHLATRYVGCRIEAHDTVDSTNRRAATLASEGCPDGTVVIADAQTAGRGRLGRSWLGGHGESLLVSVVLRPPSPEVSLIPLAAGLAVADAVSGLVEARRVKLKWPNDVLVDGLKCAGILVESSVVSGARASRWVVVGMGLNVNQPSLPAPVAERATSLRLVTGEVVARPLVLAHLLHALEERLDLLERSPGDLLSAYSALLVGINAPIEVSDSSGRVHRGVMEGVDPSGALRVLVEGSPRLFLAGDVTLRRPQRA